MHIHGYDIERTIGKGGAATVYLARSSRDGKVVALKLLGDALEPLPAGATAATVMGGETGALSPERFVNEGRIIAALRHPHIVRIHDVGDADGAHFIAMEYLSGGDLRTRLGDPLPVSAALEVLVHIGAALHHAHGKGIVHRDVKPANILFRDDGTPVLSDFGIAKEMEVDSALTATGAILGTPFYMSPEQVEGDRVDARADIYSLGIILYEMLTGERPYRGGSPFAVVVQHVQAPVPRLPGELAAAQPLLDTMMAKDRDARFGGADEVVAAASELARAVNTGADTSVHGQLSLEAMREVPRSGRGLLDEVVASFRNGILEDLGSDRLVLPSLPEVALQVRQELERPEADATSIARVLATDPATSAQVLRVANSALYFGRSPVADLRSAVVRLGGQVVQQVVMMLAVAQLYEAGIKPSLREHLEAVWRRSVHTAALSEAIARRLNGIDRNVALLAGLIHNIGTLPILVWAEPIPAIIGDPHALGEIERALHGELGERILKHWNYPPELAAVPAAYQWPAAGADSPMDVADVVRAAALLAATDSPEAHWATAAAAVRLGLEGADPAELLAAAAETRDELAASLH